MERFHQNAETIDLISSQAAEIKINILNRISIYDLLSIRSVSKVFYELVDDPRFYNSWSPNNELDGLLEIARANIPQKSQSFSYFFLWYFKYVIYRNNCIRHSYGLLDLEICNPKNIPIMTVYKTYEYLDQLTRHADSPENYIQTITELLIGFDVATALEQSGTSFWELVYGYIKIHCKRHGGKSNLINLFIEKFYTGSCIIVKFHKL